MSPSKTGSSFVERLKVFDTISCGVMFVMKNTGADGEIKSRIKGKIKDFLANVKNLTGEEATIITNTEREQSWRAYGNEEKLEEVYSKLREVLIDNNMIIAIDQPPDTLGQLRIGVFKEDPSEEGFYYNPWEQYIHS